MTVARDVSHRKSLEVSLSRSKRQAQYTLESIVEGVITTDNDGRIPADRLERYLVIRRELFAHCETFARADAEFAAMLGTYMDRMCELDLFSGSVLVARGEAVLFERAHGDINGLLAEDWGLLFA